MTEMNYTEQETDSEMGSRPGCQGRGGLGRDGLSGWAYQMQAITPGGSSLLEDLLYIRWNYIS